MDPIHSYINKRYPYWLDYAKFHATQASLHDQAGDLLHTVLESLLRKDPEYLRDLYGKKKGLYTELDFFILRMIKLNAHSPLAPYRFKNRQVPQDANSDPWKLNITDEEQEKETYNERMLRLMRRSREILDGLDIPQNEKDIFGYKFYGGSPLKSWPGSEAYSRVCLIYNQVCDKMMEAASPERYRIQMFCRTLSRVRKKIVKAA